MIWKYVRDYSKTDGWPELPPVHHDFVMVYDQRMINSDKSFMRCRYEYYIGESDNDVDYGHHRWIDSSQLDNLFKHYFNAFLVS